MPKSELPNQQRPAYEEPPRLPDHHIKNLHLFFSLANPNIEEFQLQSFTKKVNQISEALEAFGALPPETQLEISKSKGIVFVSIVNFDPKIITNNPKIIKLVNQHWQVFELFFKEPLKKRYSLSDINKLIDLSKVITVSALWNTDSDKLIDHIYKLIKDVLISSDYLESCGLEVWLNFSNLDYLIKTPLITEEDKYQITRKLLISITKFLNISESKNDEDEPTICHLGTIDKPKVPLYAQKLFEALLSKKLAGFGLNLEDFKSSGDYAFFEIDWKLNLLAIQELEKTKPGSAQILLESFGINRFYRYDKDSLLQQIELFYNQETWPDNYVLEILPISDKYNCFTNNTLSQNTQLPTVYYEVGYLGELAKVLNNQLHYKKSKITHLILRGHGLVSEITFGHLKNQGKLKDTKVKKLPNIIKSFCQSKFTENSVVVLDSCLTGTSKGIAEVISQVAGITVFGPEKDILYTTIKYNPTTEKTTVIYKTKSGEVINTKVYKGEV